jgi:hypothetical protein
VFAALRLLIDRLASQQIHKIPGTAYGARYGQDNSASSSASVSSVTSDCGFHSEQNQHSGSGSGPEAEESFKARMERLRDDTSTNLYIEGLPLSIDEAVRLFLQIQRILI